MTYFEPVSEWQLPLRALAASIEEMARDGRSGNEGVALWLGTRLDGISRIQAIVVLRGADVVKKPDLLVIGADTMNNVTDVAIDRGLALVGQIHSHGKHFGTNLSPTDHRYGVRIPHFMSVVAPEYGLRPFTGILDCGVHVFVPERDFVRLSAQEVVQRVKMTDLEDVAVITVGD
jgi:hypothetical protein